MKDGAVTLTKDKYTMRKENRYRTPAKDMTVNEKIDIVKRFKVKIPRANFIIEAIADCHESYDGINEPNHIAILGNSRLGKTTICKSYEKRYPRIETDNDDRVIVLRIETPVPATIKDLVSEMLNALGDQKADQGGNIGRKTRRLIKLLKKCGVELIIIDEFQHFLDARRGNVLKLVVHWLKNFMNKIPIPIVLVGLPTSEKALLEDEQLNNRISERIRIEPFGWEEASQKMEFKRLLYEIDQSLPFDELIGFNKGDMPLRFYDASKGILGHLTKLIRKAALISIKAGEPTIYIETLEAVWEKSIKSSIMNTVNPFSIKEQICDDDRKILPYAGRHCKDGENNRWQPTKRKTPITQLLKRR